MFFSFFGAIVGLFRCEFAHFVLLGRRKHKIGRNFQTCFFKEFKWITRRKATWTFELATFLVFQARIGHEKAIHEVSAISNVEFSRYSHAKLRMDLKDCPLYGKTVQFDPNITPIWPLIRASCAPWSFALAAGWPKFWATPGQCC